MPPIASILANTPVWVYALFAYLVWQGIQSLRPRARPLWRLLIVPAIFIVMGLSRLVLNHDGLTWSLFAWVAAVAVFAPIGLITGPQRFTVDPASGLVSRPGSVRPLVRNVLVFALQYAVAVATALHVDGHAAVAIIGRAVSGATAGYFMGWATALLRHYRHARTPAGT